MMKQRFVKWLFLTMLLPMSTSVFAGLVDKGGEFIVNGIKYIRTSDTQLFAEVAAYSYTGSIDIPASVQNIEVTYEVTGIGEEAFADNTDLTDVTLPASIGYIGASAFSGCTGLTSVTMGNAEPCNLAENAFAGIADKVTIWVPVGSKAAYLAADVWKDLNIKEIGETDAIEGDFNNDNKVSVADIVALANAIAASTTDMKFDLNGDGNVSVADIVALANIIANTSNE